MADSSPARDVLLAKMTCSRCVGSSLEGECVCVCFASQRGEKALQRRRRRRSECRRRNDVVDSRDGEEEENSCSGNEDFQEASSPWTLGTYVSSDEGSAERMAERCISSFYHYFFASHPFVLPQEQLKRIMAERTDEVQPLRAAMAWIGSLYLPVSPGFRDEAYEKARRQMAEGARVRRRHGFLLQAIMLLVLGLDGCDRRGEATAALRDAEHLALEIGLNTRCFASRYGFDTRAVEESWRRTWWELYVVDAMMAGMRRASDFVLCDVGADVALPCEEHDYVSNCIPASRVYIEHLENQVSQQQDKSLSVSSFAHRILSARILGASRQFDPRHDHEQLDRTELLLTAWRLDLPREKQASLCPDGSPDEMMFQAHMISHATSILLHQPLSDLGSSSAAGNVTSCRCGTSSHTKHVVESAAAIGNMITHRVPLISHSHFFSCIVGLSAVVHLSQWASGAPDERIRQLVRLDIAALRGLSAVWRVAERARGQVQAVAQEIYRARKGRTESRQEQEHLNQLNHPISVHVLGLEETLPLLSCVSETQTS